MNRIDFPRKDVFGDEYSQETLEKWYVSDLKIASEIEPRLLSIITSSPAQKRLKNRIIKYLPQILVMSPYRMGQYARAVDSLYGSELVKRVNGRLRATDFGNDILDAFNYSGYRYNKLVQLAARINVKTCPYCNMSYTLYSEKICPGKNHIAYKDRFARFQFDHFLSKMHYPMLSMSLYNLIPACPTCNQGKSEIKLPVIFNPYYSDIHSLFSFEIDNPLTGFVGARFKDFTPVKIVWDSSVKRTESDAFEKTFHTSILYSRHGDIVQEVFDKTYELPYYLNPAFFRFLGYKNSSYLKRLWFGNYMEKSDISNRPLSKFMQDIHLQASRGMNTSGFKLIDSK